MGNKQFFAQIGVFVLVGLNVAAYFVFWPKGETWSADGTKVGEENFAQSLSVAKKEAKGLPLPAPPADFPSSIDPASLAPVAMPSPQEKDTVTELLHQIEKDAPPSVRPPPAIGALPSLPPLPPSPIDEKPSLEPKRPRELPPLQADPVPLPTPMLPDDKKKPEIALANLTAQMHQSPWLVQMETVGARTQLVAEMKQQNGLRPASSFKILCDRVEMRAPEGALQAVGKVTFVGAGLTGTCQRLTLALNEVRIIFEEDARVAYDSAPNAAPTYEKKTGSAGLLRGERFVWEVPAAPRELEPRPVTFSMPTTSPRAILDGPR